MSAQPTRAGRSTRRIASPLRVALLVVEGHLYLAATILVFAGVLALLSWGILARRPAMAIIAVFVGVPLFLLTAAALRSLFFRMPWPEGLEATRARVLEAADRPFPVRRPALGCERHVDVTL